MENAVPGEYWVAVETARGKTVAASLGDAAAFYSKEENQMQKNKKIIIAAAVIVVLIAVMAAVFISTRPETSEGRKSFTVEVIHSDGTEKTFTYHTDAEYLGEVLLDEGLIQGEVNQFGLYIITVDGEDAIYEEDGAYWALYEGDGYAQQGIDETPVLDGSEFSLVYTIG